MLNLACPEIGVLADAASPCGYDASGAAIVAVPTAQQVIDWSQVDPVLFSQTVLSPLFVLLGLWIFGLQIGSIAGYVKKIFS